MVLARRDVMSNFVHHRVVCILHWNLGQVESSPERHVNYVGTLCRRSS